MTICPLPLKKFIFIFIVEDVFNVALEAIASQKQAFLIYVDTIAAFNKSLVLRDCWLIPIALIA